MTTTYYKATRSDGTDFRTGRVHYRVGETVTHPTSKRYSDMRPNDPSTYLSVSVESAETLIGGRWPCRLFQVEPVGRTVRCIGVFEVFSHKRGCLALNVVEEVEAWRALGPNGQEVAALIDRAERLTATEVKALDAASDARYAARYVAGDAAQLAAEIAARNAAGIAARNAAWYAACSAARTPASWFAARDAAMALVVRDLITAEQFDALYGPWATVIDQPTREQT